MAKKKAATTSTRKQPAKKSATKKSATKKTPAKKAPAAKGPGVIASIIEFLTKATAKRPLSKEQLADRLEKRFPERGREAMLRTINCQVPSRLKSDKNITVNKNDKGYWITK